MSRVQVPAAILAAVKDPAARLALSRLSVVDAGGGPVPVASDLFPADVGPTASPGVVNGQYSRPDHVHEHGDQPGGTLHDEATIVLAGFMSAADKVKLNNLPAVPPGGITAGWPAWGEISALNSIDNGTPVAASTPVLFPQALIATGGVAVINKNAAGAIIGLNNSLILPVTGRWLITVELCVNAVAQFALARQTLGAGIFVQIPGTVVGRDTATTQMMLSKIISANATDVIQVWCANGSTASLVFPPLAGGTDTAVNTFRAELMP